MFHRPETHVVASPDLGRAPETVGCDRVPAIAGYYYHGLATAGSDRAAAIADSGRAVASLCLDPRQVAAIAGSVDH